MVRRIVSTLVVVVAGAIIVYTVSNGLKIKKSLEDYSVLGLFRHNKKLKKDDYIM